jgi:hydroxymethylpyrimidine/phosphomethylpyrimidine kinase
MSSERTQDAGAKAPVADVAAGDRSREEVSGVVDGGDRPRVLVVAGYDQSGGAGVLSDVKTLEAHGVYSYAVCTGFTFQNERTISRIQWFSGEEIDEQIDICYAAAAFDWVKMGITEDVRMAGAIVDHLYQHNPAVRIVWDPVIRASSGREFWKSVGEEWKAVAARCYLLTPNWNEIRQLYRGEDVLEGCRELTRQTGCNIYLKGGHHPEFPGRDYLLSGGGMEVLEPEADGGQVYAKHGSGCVLSSALAANLAMGYPLPVAAIRSKQYARQFLSSNKTLLGWHRPLESRMG